MNEIVVMGLKCAVDENGTAYVNAKDLAMGLGFTHKEEKNGVEYETVRWATVNEYLKEFGFRQQVGENSQQVGKDDFIPEQMVYLLGMKAKNDTAKAFQRKLAYEVLPSIRKHGAYMTDDALKKAITEPDFLIRLAEELKSEKEKRAQAEAQIEADKPKVLFANALTASDSTILIRDMAKMLKDNGVDIGEKRFYRWLREHGYICQCSTTPTQKAMELGLFEIDTHVIQRNGNDLPIERSTTRVTTKGQEYFVNKFLGGKPAAN